MRGYRRPEEPDGDVLSLSLNCPVTVEILRYGAAASLKVETEEAVNMRLGDPPCQGLQRWNSLTRRVTYGALQEVWVSMYHVGRAFMLPYSQPINVGAKLGDLVWRSLQEDSKTRRG